MQSMIKEHYQSVWNGNFISEKWNLGPMKNINPEFEVLIFSPTETRDMWTYATCGMSNANQKSLIELHLFSKWEDKSLIELMTLVAYFHLTKAELSLHHTVYFGRSWLPESQCDHGFIALPYLDGPDLEYFSNSKFPIRFLWLIPVTKAEVNYKKKFGVEALENKFEEMEFDYLNPRRDSVV